LSPGFQFIGCLRYNPEGTNLKDKSYQVQILLIICTQCVFYVWLMAPIAEYNGSLILYRRIIRPKFIQYQPGLDRFLSNARETGKVIF